MKKALIFGGNQFVGMHICEKLLYEGYQVYVLNRGTRKNIEGSIHLKGDRNNERALKNLLERYEFEAVIDVSAYEPHQIEKSLKVLKSKYKKYILISSASIYQNIGEAPVKEEAKVGGNPIWGDYALNKFLCEESLKKFSVKEDSNFIIFRPFYIYGPSNNLDRENYFFNRILDEKPIFIPSKETIVQFGYVKDLSSNIFEAIKNNKFDNKVFNISGEEYLSFKEIIKVVEEVLEKKAIVKEINVENRKVRAREWFPFRTENLYGDISKLKQAGGKIEYNFKEGMEETFKHSLNNNLLGKYKISLLEEEFNNELLKN